MSEESDVSVDTQPENTAADNNGVFFVPDEYKEAGWVHNIKNYDDLWKMNANAQVLIGKKTIGIPAEDASDEEVNSFYAKTRPQSVDDYALKDDDDQDFAKLFYDNGLSKRQVANITKGIQDIYKKQNESLFSQDGFDAEMKARFGDNYKQTTDSIVNLIKRELNDKDKATLEGMPNNVVGAFYGALHGIMKRYAIKDTDTGVNGMGSVKKEADWAGYNKAAQELANRPHKMADITELKDKFNIPHS